VHEAKARVFIKKPFSQEYSQPAKHRLAVRHVPVASLKSKRLCLNWKSDKHEARINDDEAEKDAF